MRLLEAGGRKLFSLAETGNFKYDDNVYYFSHNNIGRGKKSSIWSIEKREFRKSNPEKGLSYDVKPSIDGNGKKLEFGD